MRIFIDEGHNDRNVDTGAVGNGLREQDITFDIGHMLGNKLASMGLDIKHSRNSKTDIIGSTVNDSLAKRAQMANDFKSDLFISIHCNANANAGAKGTEVYARSTGTKGYPLAKVVCDSVCNKLGTANRGAKTANYAVLKKTSMPAILVETAFITNASDAALLKNRKEDFASAVCDAVCAYYGIKKDTESSFGSAQRDKAMLESANDIIWQLMNGPLKVSIGEVDKAVKTLDKARQENSSLYWILYKIVNE